MNSRIPRVSIVGLLAWVLLAPAASAQDPPDPASRPQERELRQALRSYFQTRLRVELGLTDEQAATILPLVEDLEKVRRESSRERRLALGDLRRAYREGAPDEELERLMNRLNRIDADRRARTEALMAEIDGSLTARQRVQFRIFLTRFREQMRQRIQEIRERRRERPLDRPRRWPPGTRR